MARGAGTSKSRVRGLAREDAGITLVELLVAMLIFGILITLVTNMYASMTRTVAIGGSVNDSTKSASLGMNEMSRVIRFATKNPVSGADDDPAFVAAGRENLTVYTYVDTDQAAIRPVEVKFTLDAARRLVETRYAAIDLGSGFWGFSSTPLSSRVITGAVVAPTAGEDYLFTYLRTDGTVITTAPGGLTSSQFADVAAVQVRLKLKTDDGVRAKPVVLQNTIGLPNLGFHRTGQ